MRPREWYYLSMYARPEASYLRLGRTHARTHTKKQGQEGQAKDSKEHQRWGCTNRRGWRSVTVPCLSYEYGYQYAGH